MVVGQQPGIDIGLGEGFAGREFGAVQAQRAEIRDRRDRVGQPCPAIVRIALVQHQVGDHRAGRAFVDRHPGIGRDRRCVVDRGHRDRHRRLVRQVAVDIPDRIGKAVARALRAVMRVGHGAVAVDHDAAVGRARGDHDAGEIERVVAIGVVGGEVDNDRSAFRRRAEVVGRARRHVVDDRESTGVDKTGIGAVGHGEIDIEDTLGRGRIEILVLHRAQRRLVVGHAGAAGQRQDAGIEIERPRDAELIGEQQPVLAAQVTVAEADLCRLQRRVVDVADREIRIDRHRAAEIQDRAGVDRDHRRIVDVGHGDRLRGGQALAKAVTVDVVHAHADLGADIGVAERVGRSGSAANRHAVTQPLVGEGAESVGIADPAGIRRQHLVFGDRTGDHGQAGRRVVGGGNIHGHRVTRGTVHRAVVDAEPEAGVARAVGVGGRGEGQVAGIDIGLADHLVQGHVDTGKLQAAGTFEAGDLYAGQGVTVDIAEIEIRGGEDVIRVFVGDHRVVGCRRRVVDRSDRNRKRILVHHVRAVDVVVGVAVAGKQDAGTVGRPLRFHVDAGVVGQADLVGSVGIHDVDLPVAIAFRIKQQLRAIRRPVAQRIDPRFAGQTGLVGTIGVHHVDFVITTITG